VIASAPSQSEHEQHGGRRGVLELGRHRKDKGVLSRADQYRNVLLAIHGISNRRGIDPSSCIEAPQFLQGLCVVGAEGAVDVAEEDKIAGGRERPCIVGIVEPQARLNVARGGIQGFKSAMEAGIKFEWSASEAFACFDGATLVVTVLLNDRLDVIAALDRGDVDEPKLRIICAGLPVLTAGDRSSEPIAHRSRPRAMAARHIDLHIRIRIVVQRLPGFGVKARRPVQLIDILLASDE
jgi:hypothetical protein